MHGLGLLITVVLPIHLFLHLVLEIKRKHKVYNMIFTGGWHLRTPATGPPQSDIDIYAAHDGTVET